MSTHFLNSEYIYTVNKVSRCFNEVGFYFSYHLLSYLRPVCRWTLSCVHILGIFDNWHVSWDMCTTCESCDYFAIDATRKFLGIVLTAGLQSFITMYTFLFRQSLTHLFTYAFFHKFIQILCNIRSTVKACNKEAEPNFYGKLYLWRYIKTTILQVVKMNQ